MPDKKTNTTTRAKSPPPGRWASLSDEFRRRLRRIGAWTLIVVMLAAAGAFGMKAMERHVIRRETAVRPMRTEVRLARTPTWMPDVLAERIAADLTPPDGDFYDPALPREVYELAGRNPWVRSVARAVKRHTDTPGLGLVEVHCEFRRPMAVIMLGGGRIAYVDRQGVRLPDSDVPKWQSRSPGRDGPAPRIVPFVDRRHAPSGSGPVPIFYVTITGVSAKQCGDGCKWPGRDVADALRLMALLGSRAYARAETTVIDVANHAGRLDTDRNEIRVETQYGRGRRTSILFGRFPHPRADYCVRPAQKLRYLDQYVTKFGRLSGRHRALDLRGDELLITPY